jgi:tetratricopeptide (TPR) repeat protein
MFGSWRNFVARNITNSLVIQGDGNQIIVQRGAAPEPRLDWIVADKNTRDFDLLRWSARIAPLTGRDAEKAQLQAWAEDAKAVAGRFITGPGGAGKTRLAAELAQELRDKDWTAGFMDLSHDNLPPTPVGKNGVLLIADYPDEKPDGVRALLHALASPPEKVKIRLLLLTRDDNPARWLAEAAQAGASHLFGRQNLTPAPPLDEAAAWTVFETARTNLHEAGFDAPPPVDRSAFIDWLRRHELHRLALFVTALALHTVLAPAAPALDLTGREVIAALVARERRRLREISTAHGMAECGLERLTALAAVRGGLDEATCRRLAAPALDIGLKDENGLIDRLGKAGMLRGGRLPAPEPDMVAAALLAEVVAARRDQAPEWLWAAMDGDVKEALPRLSRLIWDAEFILKYAQPKLSEVLARAVAGNLARAAAVEPYLHGVDLPAGLIAVSTTTCRILAEHENDPAKKNVWLSNLSVRLWALGDNTGALTASEAAVRVLEDLAATDPHEMPDLATALNNLGIRYATAGRDDEALTTTRRGVRLRRRLAAVDPQAFTGELARSLSNLSNRYRVSGDNPAALKASKEAITCFRRAVRLDASPWEADLATALHNLTADLALNAADGAEAAIEEAIRIRRRLADADASRYAADLGVSLYLSALLQMQAGGPGTAIKTLREAIRWTEPQGRALPGSPPARRLANMEEVLAQWTQGGVDPLPPGERVEPKVPGEGALRSKDRKTS